MRGCCNYKIKASTVQISLIDNTMQIILCTVNLHFWGTCTTCSTFGGLKYTKHDFLNCWLYYNLPNSQDSIDIYPDFNHPYLSVFWTDEIGKCLWLFVLVVVVSMCIMVVMGVRVLSWANILHLVNATTFWASLNWAILGHLRRLVK